MHTSQPEIFDRVSEMKSRGESLVLATVIAMRGSTAAKTGAKAIFDEHGKNLLGWVGGGCAESFVAQQSLAALKERTPRIVTVDLDDEVFGLMPCGGTMDVYLEPHFAPRRLHAPNFGAWNEPVANFLRQMGYAVRFGGNDKDLTDWRSAFFAMMKIVSIGTDHPLRSFCDRGPVARLSARAPLILFGQTRITEELARMATLLEWDSTLYANNVDAKIFPSQVAVCEMPLDLDAKMIPTGAWVIVGSHHRQDNEILAMSLHAGADYLALIASPKRAGLILQDLELRGFSESELNRVFSPAGLALPSETPSQIAFSILSEILQQQLDNHES